MGQFVRGGERSNESISGDDENMSINGESGVKTSTRSLRYSKRLAPSGSPAASKDSVHRLARRESDIVSFFHSLI
jgi:hypothetical protein